MIHITEKQTGKILDYIPLGDFWDDNHHKSLKDTLEYFEFRTFGDKRYSQHLEKMNRIIIPDEDGTFIEFVIFHAIKYRLHNTVVIDVYAPASYLLLKKAKVIKPQRVSEYTASQHLGFALNGTEWRPGIVESDKYRTLDIENHTNPYAYIRRIANEFELEPRFRIETDGNKVIGRYVDLLERVGEWQGREVEFGRDLLGIERKVDDSNVVTALIGLGPERDDGTRLEVFIEDEEALQRWGIPNPQTGELMHLIETYEPESTDQDMTIERLTELTRNELEKRINSVVEYTADVADLEKVPGLENKVIRFGDTIKIKDVGFNPPLYLEARVHTQDRSLSQPEKKKVTLGDFIEYTEEEVHAIWKQLQAEIAKKVSMAEVIEVVYTKPEVDERDNAVREHADTVAENAKREAIQVAAEDASQKARQAEDNAKEYTDGRLENTVAKDIFESTVTDLLNNIAQKVDNTRFEQVESELRGIAEELQHEVAEHADTLEEHGGKITKLETDVDEATGKINATISQLEALGDTVSRHETQIEANAQAIALKADKQELDLLSGTVSDINSQLTVMAGQIEAKAERSEVEKLESDISKISQDVSKLTVDVDGIKTNVSSISQTVSNHGTQISSINSTLTQHADMIASKVEKSEFDSVTNTLGNRISTIEQTADSISLEVSNIKANVYTKSEVDNAIDGIQIGGRNLIRNSDFSNGSDYWEGQFSLTEEGALLQSTVGESHIIQSTIEIPEGEYVAQIRYKVIEGQAPYLFATNGTDMTILEGSAYFDVADNDWNTHTVRVRVRSKSRFFAIRYAMSSPADHLEGKTIISWVKLEKGNKATDWTPAPEDIDEKFTDIEGTLVSHSTKIEQNAQQIQLRATKTEVDTLTGQVSNIQSQLTVMAGEIATKVEKDGVISAINQTAEQIKIQASKVDLSGYVTFTNLSSPGQTTIDGRNLKTGSITADKLNVTSLSAISANLGTITAGTIKGVNIEGARITQTGDGGSIVLSNDGLIARDASGKQRIGIFTSRAFYSSAITFEPNTDDQFYIGTGLFGSTNHAFIGFYEDVDYLRTLAIKNGSTHPRSQIALTAPEVSISNDLRVRGTLFGKHGWFNGQTMELEDYTLKNIYIRPQSGGEVRATLAGTTDQYVNMRAQTFWAGGTSGNGVFTTASGYVVLRAAENGIAYIQSDVEVRATRRMQGSSYVPVRASSFPTGSLEEFKTNIKKWEESALDIIRNADIYEFNLKNDLEVGKNKKRYGLVIGDGYRTPEEVIDGDGIEQYAMNSISWKAIQELDTEQQELKGRIAWLEAENKLLREKIKSLEGMIS